MAGMKTATSGAHWPGKTLVKQGYNTEMMQAEQLTPILTLGPCFPTGGIGSAIGWRQ